MASSSLKFDFYVTSWLSDPLLQKCTLGAHGLWTNILCLMQKSPIKGKLLNRKGEPILSTQIPDLINKPQEVVEPLLNELIEKKVLRTDAAGVFYSKKLLEVNQKKIKLDEPFYKEAMDFYFDWHTVRFNLKPRILMVDGKALKLILQHFASLETAKHNRLQLFKIMLENWHKIDAFIQKQTDLRMINSNINRILNDLRNSNKKVVTTVKMDALVEANKKIENFDYNTLKKK